MFAPGPAERIMKDVFSRCLDNDTPYDPIDSSVLSRAIARDIQARLKKLNYQR